MAIYLRKNGLKFMDSEGNWNPAGSIASTAVEANILANTAAIEAINNETTGILATSKSYTDDEISDVLSKISTNEASITDILTKLPINNGTLMSYDGDLHNEIIAQYKKTMFSSTLTCEHPCWNKLWFVHAYPADSTNSDYIENCPDASVANVKRLGSAYVVLTLGLSNKNNPTYDRAVQIVFGCYSYQRDIYVRFVHDHNWSDWHKIVTEKTLQTMNYAIDFSKITWTKSSSGKFTYTTAISGINKILGATIYDFSTWAATDVVQPIAKDTSIQLISNTEKKSGTVSLRILYL